MKQIISMKVPVQNPKEHECTYVYLHSRGGHTKPPIVYLQSFGDGERKIAKANNTFGTPVPSPQLQALEVLQWKGKDKDYSNENKCRGLQFL